MVGVDAESYGMASVVLGLLIAEAELAEHGPVEEKLAIFGGKPHGVGYILGGTGGIGSEQTA